jgi:hypothetical protein
MRERAEVQEGQTRVQWAGEDGRVMVKREGQKNVPLNPMPARPEQLQAADAWWLAVKAKKSAQSSTVHCDDRFDGEKRWWPEQRVNGASA